MEIHIVNEPSPRPRKDSKDLLDFILEDFVAPSDPAEVIVVLCPHCGRSLHILQPLTQGPPQH